MTSSVHSPPYYAVIFTSTRRDDRGYAEMAKTMDQLASQQPGYLGIDSARSEQSVTVSYWRDLDSIAAWKSNAQHLLAQRQGKDRWYAQYTVRIARVEREYEFTHDGA